MEKEISPFIVQSPEIRNNRPRIKGTGVTIHRIATWYNLGFSPEQIAIQIPHLSLDKIFIALAYYFAHQEVIDAEIAEEDAKAARLEAEHYKNLQPAL